MELGSFSVLCLLKAKPEDTLDLCKIINDDLAQSVAKYPDRFKAFGTLPMQAPELAATELKRCVKELGRYVCLLMTSAVNIELFDSFV